MKNKEICFTIPLPATPLRLPTYVMKNYPFVWQTLKRIGYPLFGVLVWLIGP